MATKRIQKQIVDSYTKKNMSLAQIAREFDLSVSSVRHWLKKFDIPKRSISEGVTNWYTKSRNKRPFKLLENLSVEDEKLRMAGIMLYWGEGAKTRGAVKFANSDPKMIKVFLEFLRRICGIYEDRLKAIVHLYPDLDEYKLRKFWSKATKIPLKRFYRSHIHKGKVGTYKNKSVYGTIAVNYSDTLLLKTILGWVEEYADRIVNNKPV